MRFSVTSLVQDAPFREGAGTECVFPYNTLFLTCANVEPSHGKAHSAQAASRKSAVWVGGLTEKRILEGWGHGKTQSAILRSRKLRFSVTLPS